MAFADRVTRADIDDCEEDERYEYWIGNDPSGDEVRCSFVTRPRERPLFARVLEIGATPYESATQQPTAFSEAEFSFLDRPGGPTTVLIPTLEGPALSRLHGVVAFIPPIALGSAVEWGYELRWPGMWDRLRETGFDLHQSVLDGTRAAKLEVMLHFPYAVDRLQIDVPSFGDVDYPDSRTFRWSATRPRAGEHVFSLRCR